MITIKPNYDFSPTCYYCNKAKASKKEEQCEDYYRLTGLGTFTVSAEYIRAKVYIPRCKSCSNKHFIAALPLLLTLLASFAFYLYLLLTNGWNEHIGGILLGCVLSFIGASITAVTIGYIPRLLINQLLFKHVKDEGDTDGYMPVHRLKKMGFQFGKRPDPAGSRGADTDFDSKLLYKEIDNMVYEDHCEVSY